MRRIALHAHLFLIAGLCLGLFTSAHGKASAQLNKQDQKCVNAINKGAAKVAKAQAGDNAACIKNGSTDKLGSQTIEACIRSDPKGKVSKAISKIKVSDCDPNGPLFPPIDTDADSIGQTMVQKDLDLIHALFGSDLDSVIADPAQKAAGKCQSAIAKAVAKCQDTKLKVFNKCKKDGLKGKTPPGSINSAQDLEDLCLGTGANPMPDPKGKILGPKGKCDGKLIDAVTKKCDGLSNLNDLIPGCTGAVGPAALAACLDQKVECEVCKALNALDGLDRNCDEFDDGMLNQSCDTCPLPFVNLCEEACCRVEKTCGFSSACPLLGMDCATTEYECEAQCLLSSECGAIGSLLGSSPDPQLAACLDACGVSPACDTACLAQSCSVAMATCYQDASCAEFLGCAVGCADTTCVSECYAASPSYLAEDVLSCGCSSCPADCSTFCVTVEPLCGDGAVNQVSEECDGTDLAGMTCEDFGLTSGTLTCDPSCHFDTSTCVSEGTCGDNVVNQPSEECDGIDQAACPGQCKPDCTCLVCEDVVADGGLEGGTPSASWTEYSSNFGTPICDEPSCGLGGGSGTYAGSYWAWFGGGDNESAYLEQTVTIPVGTATLRFYLELPVCEIGSWDGFEVRIDGVQVYYTDGLDPNCNTSGYFQKAVNVSTYADGGSHILRLSGWNDVSNNTNFMADNIELVVCP